MMLTPKVPTDAELERSIELASKALLDCQQPDGHWVFELEVDATISAEYVLLKHYLGEGDELGIEVRRSRAIYAGLSAPGADGRWSTTAFSI